MTIIYQWPKLLPPTAQPVNIYFQNITIENNVFHHSPAPRGIISFAGSIDLANLPDPAASGPRQVVTGNNVIKNNNFGAGTFGLFVNPSGAVTDGGGNICQPSGFSPLACSGPAPLP